MNTLPKETRPAAPPITYSDRKEVERWRRYFYSLHLAVMEHEKIGGQSDTLQTKPPDGLLEKALAVLQEKP